MKSVILAATLYLAALSTALADGWAPLSQKEIDDAHTCFGGGQVMICAGDKKIMTGLSFNNNAHGTEVVGYLGELQNYQFPSVEGAFAVDIEIMFTQKPESGGPTWNKKYYVITDEQLTRIIKMAREKPEWKP